jgi:aromatic-L-amino-acid decarboxylase
VYQPLSEKRSEEETLDPSDWEKFRKPAHQVLDGAITYVSGIRQYSVCCDVPEAVKARPRQRAPEDLQNDAHVSEEFRTLLLRYAYANPHPRARGWVIGAGTAQGNLARDMDGRPKMRRVHGGTVAKLCRRAGTELD